MAKLSDIIDPIFREYAPICTRSGLRLDLDLENPITEVKDPATLEFELKKYLNFTISSSPKQGSIVISSRAGQVLIKDSATVLTPDQCQQFTSQAATAKSRVGFGTTITINL